MSDCTPLLLSLAPSGTAPLSIPGFDCCTLNPFPDVPSSVRVSLPEIETAWTHLQEFLRDQSDHRPMVLYGEGAYGTLAVYALCQTRCFYAGIVQSALVDPLSALALSEAVLPDPQSSLDSQIHALAADCVLEKIRSISAPLLVLHGEDDSLVPSAQADELFVLMKSLHPDLPSRLVLFPGEGHAWSDTATAAALDEITRFLRVLPGGEGSR